MFDKKNLLGVGITNASYQQVLEYIVKGLLENAKKYYIVTVNPEILILARKNLSYKKILNKAKLALPDGIGIMLAGKILGEPLKARITGVDLLEDICRKVAEKPITVGFLGGRDGVAERTAECLQKKYPGLKVGFAGEEWSTRGSPHPFNDSSNPNLKQSANLARANASEHVSEYSLFKSSFRGGTHPFSANPRVDILLVAFGFPKQEMWISQNLDKLPVRVAIGAGGSFDYISGKVKRAPLLIRNLGFEWLFRLIVQPWRIKRQLALLEFIFLVLREKVALKREF